MRAPLVRIQEAKRLYTIGELSKAAGVPATTVRFYERKGLLQPEGRTEPNYRTYGPASLERLLFIVASKRAGFTLGDIGRLLDLRAGIGDCCGDVKDVIEQRVTDLAGRIRELKHAERVLRRALTWCEEQGGEGRCPVLDDLGQSAG
jgi:DNA-binding transcriptional MerR regulator